MKRPGVPAVSPGEDVDTVLGAFFKAQMPSPFPAFQPPAPRTLPLRPATFPRATLFTSRLVLAAAVVLLLFACWLLPGSSQPFSDPVTLPGAGPGTASKNGLLAPIPRREKDRGDLAPFWDEIDPGFPDNR